MHCIEFVIGSQPLLQECFSGSHSNIYDDDDDDDDTFIKVSRL